MEKTLGKTTLKSGETMTVVQTVAPAPEWTDRILPFLNHKGESWLAPMRQAYDRGLDELEMINYLGLLDSGEIVGNINTFEHQGVGILGHVFTPEEHRRKGICTVIIELLRDDFIARGGRALYLGTGYDTHPYHIYETIGFVGRGDSGKMTWLAEEGFLETYFAPGETTIRETRWEDWPKLDALYATEGQWQLKNFAYQLFGHCGFEGPYLTMRRQMEEDAVLDVKVLTRGDGAVVGHAMLSLQPSWKGRVLVLDLMLHANFYCQAGGLIDSISVPAGRKVQAFCDGKAEAKMAALEAAGFEREGAFKQQMEDENHQPMDVVVLGKIG